MLRAAERRCDPPFQHTPCGTARALRSLRVEQIWRRTGRQRSHLPVHLGTLQREGLAKAVETSQASFPGKAAGTALRQQQVLSPVPVLRRPLALSSMPWRGGGVCRPAASSWPQAPCPPCPPCPPSHAPSHHPPTPTSTPPCSLTVLPLNLPRKFRLAPQSQSGSSTASPEARRMFQYVLRMPAARPGARSRGTGFLKRLLPRMHAWHALGDRPPGLSRSSAALACRAAGSSAEGCLAAYQITPCYLPECAPMAELPPLWNGRLPKPRLMSVTRVAQGAVLQGPGTACTA